MISSNFYDWNVCSMRKKAFPSRLFWQEKQSNYQRPWDEYEHKVEMRKFVAKNGSLASFDISPFIIFCDFFLHRQKPESNSSFRVFFLEWHPWKPQKQHFNHKARERVWNLLSVVVEELLWFPVFWKFDRIFLAFFLLLRKNRKENNIDANLGKLFWFF